MATRHLTRTLSSVPLHAARPVQRSAVLPALRPFKTVSAQRAGPVQTAAAATVPLPDDGSKFRSTIAEGLWAHLLASAAFIRGTVNDPTTFPAPNKYHGSLHWTFERVISAALIPIVGTTFVVSPNPVLDGVLAASLVLHSHMGFDSAVTDYVHKRKFPRAGPFATWTLRALTIGTLIGIYEFNTNDIGLTELVIRTWKA